MSEDEPTAPRELVIALDDELLVDMVHTVEQDSHHSWRLASLHQELAKSQPELTLLLDHMELIDRTRTPDGRAESYRGALLALLALARASEIDDEESDDEEAFFESAANPSFASVLRQLTPDGAEALLTKFMQPMRAQQRLSGITVDEQIGSIIQQHPGIDSFVTEIARQPNHTEEYRAGLQSGAREMFMLIRELAGNERLRQEAEQHITERSVDPDAI